MDESDALHRLFTIADDLTNWPYGLSNEGQRQLGNDLKEIWVTLHRAIEVEGRLAPKSA